MDHGGAKTVTYHDGRDLRVSLEKGLLKHLQSKIESVHWLHRIGQASPLGSPAKGAERTSL